MHTCSESPELVAPTPAVRRSFHTAMAELQSEAEEPPGRGYYHGPLMEPELAPLRANWESEPGFARFVAWLAGMPRRPYDPDGLVPTTHLWWVCGEDYLGRVSLRHALNRRLATGGGHVGYVIRPSARGQGHATAMLLAARGPARDLGIAEILLTIKPENLASRRVALGAGAEPDDGTHEETRDVPSDQLRFWLPTGL
jgi:predicted acetyltransferase